MPQNDPKMYPTISSGSTICSMTGAFSYTAKGKKIKNSTASGLGNLATIPIQLEVHYDLKNLTGTIFSKTNGEI